jgi:hypothetical protein
MYQTTKGIPELLKIMGKTLRAGLACEKSK